MHGINAAPLAHERQLKRHSTLGIKQTHFMAAHELCFTLHRLLQFLRKRRSNPCNGIRLWSTTNLRNFIRMAKQTQCNLQPLGVLCHIHRADSCFFGSKTFIFPAATWSSWKQKYMRELNAKATGLSLSSLSSKSVLRRSSVTGVRNRSWNVPTKEENDQSCDQRDCRCHLRCQCKKSSPSWVLTCFSVSPGLSTVLQCP